MTPPPPHTPPPWLLNNTRATLPVCAIFQLGFLTSLEVLELSDSGLHGTLPTELAQLEQMSALHTSRASISGTLPTQLGLLSMLEYLKLDENQISGSLVPELGDLVRARHIDLEANPISGTVPDMFVRFRGLEYWNTFGCNLTGHLPQTVKRIAQRREHFEFFVQDEQLELMADFKCRRDNFRYQRDHPVREGGRPFKGNFGKRLISDYDKYARSYCTARSHPQGLTYAVFGPGERDYGGYLLPGHSVQWLGEGADPVLRARAEAAQILPNTAAAWAALEPPSPPVNPPPEEPPHPLLPPDEPPPDLSLYPIEEGPPL
jgi:hypothetical protein